MVGPHVQRAAGSLRGWRHRGREPRREEEEDFGEPASVLLETTAISVVCFETASAVK